MGLRNLAKLNKALLGKWSWWFAKDRGASWKQDISGKYVVKDGGRRSKEVRESYGVGLWKVIRKDWDLLTSRVAFSIGSGWRVQFWKDKLCGDEVLCTTLPSLYVIVDFKEDWVKNVWHSTVEGDYWAYRFSRLLNDWDLDLIERFLLSFQGVCTGKRKIKWFG